MFCSPVPHPTFSSSSSVTSPCSAPARCRIGCVFPCCSPLCKTSPCCVSSDPWLPGCADVTADSVAPPCTFFLSFFLPPPPPFPPPSPRWRSKLSSLSPVVFTRCCLHSFLHFAFVRSRFSEVTLVWFGCFVSWYLMIGGVFFFVVCLVLFLFVFFFLLGISFAFSIHVSVEWLHFPTLLQKCSSHTQTVTRMIDQRKSNQIKCFIHRSLYPDCVITNSTWQSLHKCIVRR